MAHQICDVDTKKEGEWGDDELADEELRNVRDAKR